MFHEQTKLRLYLHILSRVMPSSLINPLEFNFYRKTCSCVATWCVQLVTWSPRQLINPRTVGMALYYIIILCVDEGAIHRALTRNRVHNFMKHAIFISHSILPNKFVLSCIMKLCTWGLQHTFFISHNILHNKFVLSCVVQLCVVYCLLSIQVNM